MANIADILIKLGLDSSKFHKGTEDAKKDVQGLVKTLDGSIDGFKSFGAGLLKKFALPSAMFGMAKVLLDTAHAAAELKREANELDVTPGMDKALHKAATLTRTPFDQVSTGLEHTRKSQSEALQGDKGKLDDFARLGISVRDLQNLGGEEIFLKIADGVAKGSINAANFSSFLAVMGKQANSLVPAFKDGFAEIASSAKSSIGTEIVNALDEVDKGWVRIKATVSGFFKGLKTEAVAGAVSLGKLTGAASSLVVAAFGVNTQKEVGRAVDALTDRELMNDPAYGEGLDLNQKLEKKFANKSGIKLEKKRKDDEAKAEKQKRDDDEAYKLRDQNDKRLAEMRVNALPKAQQQIVLMRESADLQKKLSTTGDLLEREKIKSQIEDAEQKLASIKPEQKNLIQARTTDTLGRQGLFTGGTSEQIIQQAAVEQVAIMRLQLNESRRTVERLTQLNRNLTATDE